MAINSGSIAGLDALIRDTMKIADKALPGLRIASLRSANIVLIKAKQLAPVDKTGSEHAGTLRDSLVVKKMSNRKSPYTISYKVTFGKGAAYGIPVELGHDQPGRGQGERIKARPFLRPASDESKDQVAEEMIQALNTELDKWGGRS